MASNNIQPREPVRRPEQRSHLADLIRRRRAELNMGLKAFAERAVDLDTGTRVTRGWIYRLEQGEPVTPPVYEELVALAAACEYPVEVLQDAAGSQFHGVDPLVSGSSEAKAYVHKLDQLPPDQRQQLLRLIDTLAPPGEAE
ncbi:helix-turn-helix domain-containing protein [Streptomyces achromogenes]|uniref:helix-turn-helix domain-containing protein n=1 Tax=Streptomyces achromogenes TaxID=67255 RepID=UPI003700D995